MLILGGPWDLKDKKLLQGNISTTGTNKTKNFILGQEGYIWIDVPGIAPEV